MPTEAAHEAYNRRASDRRIAALEQTLAQHETREESKLVELIEKIDTIQRDVAEVSEVLKAWNNAKGFIQTVNTIAKIVAVVAVCISPFVAFG